MRNRMMLGTSILALTIIGRLGGGFAVPVAAAGNVLRAHADVFGPVGSGISGVVQFTQSPADADNPEPGVWIVARVEGLTPGAHGLHIHENGVCEAAANFTTAGGHFDPGPFGQSNPDANHPFHMGDVPNLIVNNGGVGHMNHQTSRITLSPGPLSVFDANGSAVIVHLNPDQGITGVSGASGGPRVACGVIELDGQ
jgi:superoxide dismutase, Cu-Zn family